MLKLKAAKIWTSEVLVIFVCTFATFSFGQTPPSLPELPETTEQPEITPEEREQLEKAARAAKQARLERYQRDIIPWLHQGVRGRDGQTTTLRKWKQEKAENAIERLPERIRQATEDQQAFEAQVARDGGLLEIGDENGPKARAVLSADGSVNYLITHSINAADTISTDEVQFGASSGFDLTGAGRLMGIWDSTAVKATHWEFGDAAPPNAQSRVIQKDSAGAADYHATAVAGIMSSIGVIYSPPYGLITLGMAPRSDVWAYDYFTLETTEMESAAAQGLELSNHSYGAVGGWQVFQGVWYWYGYHAVDQYEDYKFGYYNERPHSVDNLAKQFPYYLTVWSAGNELSQRGPSSQPVAHLYRLNPISAPTAWSVSSVSRGLDGDADGYDSLEPDASAKNILSVGAVEDIVGGYTGPSSVFLAGFSSRGPTDDGRIKPDIVANGVALTTPKYTQNNDYYYGNQDPTITGTSFAAPGVTGSIALLAELHEELRPSAMTLMASTMRGLVIHTADEAGANPGPDFQHGWGLMNTLTAAELLEADYDSESRAHLKEVLLEDGDYIEFPVVSNGSQSLRVTICWTDPAGPVDTTITVDPTMPRLVNDLDLRVTAPSTAVHQPWILNPDLVNESATVRASAATTGDNFGDNVEQVYIANPRSGTYTVRITHKGSLDNNDSQWVSILISGNTPQPKLDLGFITEEITPGGDFAVVWQSLVGQRYQLQYRDNVGDTGWTDIGPEVSASKVYAGLELSSPTQSRRFFQVVEVE